VVGGTEAYRWQTVIARIVVQPEAEADLIDAFGWYEWRQFGLGQDFLYEINRVFEGIAEHPLLAPQVWREARRALPRRFP
jgi:toxin ParE1/3/4